MAWDGNTRCTKVNIEQYWYFWTWNTTGRVQLIRSHSLAMFYFELSEIRINSIF